MPAHVPADVPATAPAKAPEGAPGGAPGGAAPPPDLDARDRAYMSMALGLARRGLGQVWPNPSVGCVLVGAAGVIGRGWTQPGGRPHAETEALARAGQAARGATAYVTLEPCAHHGQTPPCAVALIEAGIARAVIAMGDPDPRVDGGGTAQLRDAGIAVREGVCEDQAALINEGFVRRILYGRPMVTLKLATTLDGRIATHAGESKWITGAQSRAMAHILRARHDAILVGAGTALADDPALTCRLPGLAHRSPVRVVLDGRLRLPLTSAVVRSARDVPTWLITLADAPSDRRAAFADCGVELLEAGKDMAGNLDIAAALKLLAARGITRLLVEGGSHVAASLLRAGLVDRLIWFRAGKVIGGDGVAALAGFGLERLDRAPGFQRVARRDLGADVMEIYRQTG